MDSEIRGIEDLRTDAVYMGLYEDSPDVVQYLDVAGIQVGETLRTPFTPDMSTNGTVMMVLQRTQDRYVLVILGDSQRSLVDMIGRLNSGTFRGGLVDPLVGV